MNRVATNQIDRRSYICGLLLTLLLALGSLYMYLLSAAVVHVVMQKQIDSDINKISAEIAKLESAYIEKQHALSKEVATLDGFIDAKNKIFITKGDAGLALGSR